MNHRRKLIAVLVSAACATANAGTVTNPREFKGNPCGAFMMAFVNGINNTPEEANISLNNLAAAYGNAYLGHPLNYVLGYNQTNGIPEDFYASLMKVIASKAGATWDKYYNYVQSGIASSGMSATTAASISTTVDNLFGLIKPPPYPDADLVGIYNAIMARWSAGTRMVVLTHSEGNLFAVPLYNKLIAGGVPSTSIGFVGVASPDDTSPKVNFTSKNDVVIHSIRTAVANVPGLLPPLPANITIPYNYAADRLGHSMETYLGDPGAKLKIITAMYEKMNTLKTPIKLGSANTGASKFQGMAAWADCTGIKPYGDQTKFGAERWPAGRPYDICGSGASLYPTPYYVPMVWYKVAGGQLTTGSGSARPGQPAEVPGLANAHRDGCIAAAAGFYKTWVATGTVNGTFYNCSEYTNGFSSDYMIDLAMRYRDLNSGDGGLKTSWSTTWTAASLGIGPYLNGGTKTFTGPTCRN